jgi:hypothetical protein
MWRRNYVKSLMRRLGPGRGPAKHNESVVMFRGFNVGYVPDSGEISCE